jgi:hypothetical protein
MHLIKTLDAERYAPAGALCSSECRHALVWFDWETQMSKALYEILRHLENALRRAMAGRLTAHYGREDWWRAPRLQLTYGTRQKIEQAEDRLLDAGVPWTAVGVQRELTLGFWVALLGRGRDYETQLWRPMASGFPGYRGRRQPLHERLNYLRELRNKVAHQEPVSGRHLAADRASVITALGYVSESAARWVALTDAAIPELLTGMPGRCPRIGGGPA